jgi:cation diffusion facilitator family transporter
VAGADGAALLDARQERVSPLPAAAAPASPVATPPPRSERGAAVVRVLVHVLLLNLAVALAKIAFGFATGATSILSDGFHSLTDAAANVVGLIGVHIARQPPDVDHPYGHRKYETVAAAAVTAFLFVVVLGVLRNAFSSLIGQSKLEVSAMSFVVMLITIVINLGVVQYEGRAAVRLGSEMLQADAMQTRGDVWTSLAVLCALAGVRLGLPILDPIAAIASVPAARPITCSWISTSGSRRTCG